MILFRGIAASPGQARGAVVFTPEAAMARASESPILFRIETSHEDSNAIRAASAVVVTRGGITADAAIIARTLGKPCVVSCSGVRIDYSNRVMHFIALGVARSIGEGEIVTVDGSAGTISD